MVTPPDSRSVGPAEKVPMPLQRSRFRNDLGGAPDATDETAGLLQGGEARDDGTGQLLRWGLSTLLTGVLAALLMKTVLGGISQQGPHTNGGWLALIVAMMCLPFGSLLTLLGAAKWFRNQRSRRELR